MTICCLDFDNTLIYSYKHDWKEPKRCVEYYHGREGAFLSERSWRLLRELSHKAFIVPVTTRSVEQYRRVDLGIGELPYALACNGGVLLTGETVEERWRLESHRLAQKSGQELARARLLMEKDKRRSFEVREVEGLFLFTKSGQAQASAAWLRRELDSDFVEVFHSGRKVYAMPKELTKGSAVSRLKERLKADRVVAAGDSGLDVSMLQCADIGIAPARLEIGETAGKLVKVEETGKLFSEAALECMLSCIR